MSNDARPQRSALETYSMWVCFFALVVFTFFLGSGVYHIATYLMPETLMRGFEYQKYASNEGFCQVSAMSCFEDGKINGTRLADEAITAKREKELRVTVATTRHDSLIALFWACIYLPITAVIFLIHWRIGWKARETRMAKD